jgi:hypothetical protein
LEAAGALDEESSCKSLPVVPDPSAVVMVVPIFADSVMPAEKVTAVAPTAVPAPPPLTAPKRPLVASSAILMSPPLAPESFKVPPTLSKVALTPVWLATALMASAAPAPAVPAATVMLTPLMLSVLLLVASAV